MNKKWGIIAVVAAVLFAAAYIGSPFWAARQFREAALAADADALDERVDFPAVRDRLKSQMTAMLTDRMNNDPSMKDNPFAGLGMMLVPTMVNNMVDGYVTPDGLSMILRRGKADAPKGETPKLENVSYDYEYQGLDRFAVKVRGKDVPADKAPAFVFERRGLFTWKMTRLQIPVDALKPVAEKS